MILCPQYISRVHDIDMSCTAMSPSLPHGHDIHCNILVSLLVLCSSRIPPTFWLVLIVYLGLCKDNLKLHCSFKSYAKRYAQKSVTPYHPCLLAVIPAFLTPLSHLSLQISNLFYTNEQMPMSFFKYPLLSYMNVAYYRCSLGLCFFH